MRNKQLISSLLQGTYAYSWIMLKATQKSVSKLKRLRIYQENRREITFQLIHFSQLR